MNILSKIFKAQPSLKIIILRCFGIISSIVFSLIAIKYFVKIGTSESAILLNILALLAFCSLVQFGMSRPAYAEILSCNSNNLFKHKKLIFFVHIFKLEYYFSLFLFALLAYFLAVKANLDKNNLVDILLFSLGATSIYAGVFQRDIAYASGNESKYEKYDLIRKITLLIFIILCYLNINFSFLSISLMAFGIYLYNKFDNVLVEVKFNLNAIIEELKYKNQFLKNSRKNLLFSINELIIYNFPIIYFSFFPSISGIIYFVIWNRFFTFATIPFKLLIDSYITDIVKNLHSGYYTRARNSLCKIYIFSLLILAITIYFVYSFQSYFFTWLGTDINNNRFFFASLATWSFFNLGQHCIGSLMSALHFSYRFLFWISTFSVIVISFGYIYLFSLEENIGKTIFIISFIYGLLSITYYSFLFIYFRKLSYIS